MELERGWRVAWKPLLGVCATGSYNPVIMPLCAEDPYGDMSYYINS